MKCGVIVFPGSNGDHDVYHVLKHVLDQDVTFLWHGDRDLQGCELVVLPGGFSYGDYLRAGAMASFAAIMAEVKRHAEAGGPVLGICNGFQMLLEAELLPGAMLHNRDLRFICRDVYLRVERTDLPFTSRYSKDQVIRVPIAHAEGNYYASEEALDELEDNGQVIFRYVAPSGELDEDWNVNGSAGAVAGLVNSGGNVLGMMPHPERCAEQVLGNNDGLALFAGLVETVQEGLAS